MAGEALLDLQLVLAPSSHGARMAVAAAGALRALVLEVKVAPAQPPPAAPLPGPALALQPVPPPGPAALPPHDVLIKIAELCDPGDLPSLRLVNTALRDAVHDAGIELRPVGARLDTIEKVQRLHGLFPCATSLDFSHSEMPASHLGIFLRLCSAFSCTLTHLNLDVCWWVENDHACGLLALNLPKLKALSLDKCAHIYAPCTALEGLTRLTGLEQLILSNHDIIQLPHSITALVTLRKLDISGCSSLKLLPENLLFSLTGLQELSLGGPDLEALPGGLGSLSLLTSFNLWGCNWSIEMLPSDFANLTSLLSLDLSGCHEISKLPEDICNLSLLQTLTLWDTGVIKLPEGLSRLTALRLLIWGGGWHASPLLGPLPEGLGQLSSLETLSVRGGGLSLLPASLGKAVGLRTLCMTHADQLLVRPKSTHAVQSGNMYAWIPSLVWILCGWRLYALILPKVHAWQAFHASSWSFWRCFLGYLIQS